MVQELVNEILKPTLEGVGFSTPCEVWKITFFARDVENSHKNPVQGSVA